MEASTRMPKSMAADGDEVGGVAGQHHHGEGEEHGKRDGECGDDRGADVAEHEEQDERDEHKAGDDDVLNGVPRCGQ